MTTEKDISEIPNTDIGWLTWLSTQPKPIECENAKVYSRILSIIGQLHLNYGCKIELLEIWV